MSKRTRYSDNSKRQQPVQQQRAQAAQQVINQKKGGKLGDERQGSASTGSSPARGQG